VLCGTVKWFDRASGHGYVVPDGGGQELYVHRVSLAGDLRLTLAAGDRLEFETRTGGTGPEAVNVVAQASRRSSAQILVAIEAGRRHGHYDPRFWSGPWPGTGSPHASDGNGFDAWENEGGASGPESTVAAPPPPTNWFAFSRKYFPSRRRHDYELLMAWQAPRRR
jgi:CspA family cold shock protein